MSLSAVACDRVAISSTSPGAVGVPAALSAEPLSVRPEFLPSPQCFDRPAFGLRVFISLRGRDVTLRGLRFRFIDLIGTQTLPDVIRMPTPTSNASSLPSASPVIMPGIAALPPLPISSPIPFFARFGCGVLPKGTLVIVGEMSQTNGAMQLVEMKVGVQ
jgi:hypothetical protein